MILRQLWSYKKLGGGTLMITSYKGIQDDITVPKKIGKSIVTHIGDYAFSPNNPKINSERVVFFKTIKKVIIPDTVKRIGSCAFENCRELNAVDIPDSVMHMGYSVFAGTALEYMKLPSRLDIIEHCTFMCCRSLREVIIPNSVGIIDEMAFYGCNSLSEIVLPEGIREIYNNAFADCGALKKLCCRNQFFIFFKRLAIYS